MRRNGQRGYPWNKQTTVYHATIAMSDILDGGFKTRAQLADRTNAVGGGTDAAISLTLDIRVARAIVLGLRMVRRIARGEQTLGEMIIQGSLIAPQANQYALDEHKLADADFVHHIDRGLVPFYSGYGRSGRGTGLPDATFDALLASGQAQYVIEHRAGASSKPYLVEGWAPIAVMAELTQALDSRAVTPTYIRRNYHWAFYKTLLSAGDMLYKELYDPFFMSTDLDVIGRVPEDEIGILSMRVDADWVCASPPEAEKFGYSAARGADHQWSEGCAQRLDMAARYGTKHGPGLDLSRPREWDNPIASDTIAYLGSHMAELRTWDVSMLKDIRRSENVDDVCWDVGRDWGDSKRNDGSEEFGKLMNAPIAHPFFAPKTPYVRER